MDDIEKKMVSREAEFNETYRKFVAALDKVIKNIEDNNKTIISSVNNLIKVVKSNNNICEARGCTRWGMYSNDAYDSLCEQHKNYGLILEA